LYSCTGEQLHEKAKNASLTEKPGRDLGAINSQGDLILETRNINHGGDMNDKTVRNILFTKIVVGIDPDSDKHGVAIYNDGELDSLESWQLTDVIDFLECMHPSIKVVFSIENVMANQFVYSRNNQKNMALQGKIGMSIGRCQQSQVEIMRILDHYEVPYVLHKPTKDNWDKDKNKFQKVTGWIGKSNEDTRSAAYFGFLALK